MFGEAGIYMLDSADKLTVHLLCYPHALFIAIHQL